MKQPERKAAVAFAENVPSGALKPLKNSSLAFDFTLREALVEHRGRQ